MSDSGQKVDIKVNIGSNGAKELNPGLKLDISNNWSSGENGNVGRNSDFGINSETRAGVNDGEVVVVGGQDDVIG